MPNTAKKWHLPSAFNITNGSFLRERHSSISVPVIELPSPTQSSCLSTSGERHKHTRVSFDLGLNQCLTYQTNEVIDVNSKPILGYVSSTGEAPGEQKPRSRSASLPNIPRVPTGAELILGWSRNAGMNHALLTFHIESGIGAM
ncbi:hypothetical protein FBUS_06154 [Fasciolopsis buskii]|uniref:Uncharacterized protein n=1 Tax=Fasciolopsis buskii TaxID=27845 RepID=A0A8E0VK76_9TREM|nr:hypothetical protein FBUS_06154 [Fasciolopsis buski]